MQSPRVGIEKLTAYPCQLVLDMAALARARGVAEAHPLEELLVRERSLNPPWEDPVTMGTNAARMLLAGEDPEQIGLCVFASESAVDFGKPMSTWVHRNVGLSPNCRNYESKHACYGGTAGLMMAAHWIASGMARGRKALVVCADQSRPHPGKPWEFVLGAGATAMLVSDKPDVISIELADNGYWTQEISDTYRPTARDEVGHAETSLFGYMDGLEGAYAHYVANVGDVDIVRDFARNIYHVPFGGMTYRAHRHMLRAVGKYTASEARRHWQERTAPSLAYNGRFGGTYTSATFIALLGLLDTDEGVRAGDKVSVYSYGSGSCAEFWAGRVGEAAREKVRAQQVKERLDARLSVEVATYEAIEAARMELVERRDVKVDRARFAAHWDARYEGRGLLVLDGIDGWERCYRSS